MMCATASLQVCLDIGADEKDATRRWRLAHALGPVLVAAFANSPWNGDALGPAGDLGGPGPRPYGPGGGR